jgi:hypothetical protein
MGDDTAPVAPKVKWSALIGALVGLILTGLPAILADQSIVPGVPIWVSVLIGVLAGGGLPGTAGYLAPHQPRTADYGTTPGPVADYPEGYQS